ncbi:MAG: GGDEF domain-containing protein, partial [Selenomonadaceae bacterium]|nr:GGDEF domain-containing protein [Selenomonadaceae bacterium]
ITVTAAELESANRKLAMLASQDRLTEIFNRGEIEQRLKLSVRGMREMGKPLSVIMLDLDNFKSINDTFGHEMGDLVLKTAARVLRENIRASDAAGRWGGEEFLVVLPGAALESAVEVAERIRETLSSKSLLPDRQVTASLGVAEVREGEEYKPFYQRLDANLYTAKHSGKNCVVS